MVKSSPIYNQEYFANLEKSDRIELPRNERILKEIEKNYPAKGLMLDVGVGSGLFLRLAKKSGWQIFGLDVSDYAIKKIKKQMEGEFKTGQISQAPWKKSYFDVINMRHTIEHVQNPPADLKKANVLLKPGGLIAIATPNSFGPHAKIFGPLWPHWSLPYHLHFFSKNSLKKIVEDAGFEVLMLKTEELTSYDPLKLLIYKMGIKKGYLAITFLSMYLNIFIAKLGQGEGLLLIARKPKQTRT